MPNVNGWPSPCTKRGSDRFRLLRFQARYAAGGDHTDANPQPEPQPEPSPEPLAVARADGRRRTRSRPGRPSDRVGGRSAAQGLRGRRRDRSDRVRDRRRRCRFVAAVGRGKQGRRTHQAGGSLVDDPALISQPGATRLPLQRSSEKLTVVVGRSDRAVLISSNLAPAPTAKEYEVWVIRAGEPRRAGLFAGGSGGTVIALTRDLPPGATVAVTLEPRAAATYRRESRCSTRLAACRARSSPSGAAPFAQLPLARRRARLWVLRRAGDDRARQAASRVEQRLSRRYVAAASGLERHGDCRSRWQVSCQSDHGLAGSAREEPRAPRLTRPGSTHTSYSLAVGAGARFEPIGSARSDRPTTTVSLSRRTLEWQSSRTRLRDECSGRRRASHRIGGCGDLASPRPTAAAKRHRRQPSRTGSLRSRRRPPSPCAADRPPTGGGRPGRERVRRRPSARATAEGSGRGLRLWLGLGIGAGAVAAGWVPCLRMRARQRRTLQRLRARQWPPVHVRHEGPNLRRRQPQESPTAEPSSRALTLPGRDIDGRECIPTRRRGRMGRCSDEIVLSHVTPDALDHRRGRGGRDDVRAAGAGPRPASHPVGSSGERAPGGCNVVAPSEEPELEQLCNVASFATEIDSTSCGACLRAAMASPPRRRCARDRQLGTRTLRSSIRPAPRPTRPTGLQRRCMRKTRLGPNHHSISMSK